MCSVRFQSRSTPIPRQDRDRRIVYIRNKVRVFGLRNREDYFVRYRP